MRKMKLDIQLFGEPKSVSSSKHDGRYLKLTVSEIATDVVANTSTVHWKFESIGGNSTYYTIYKYGIYCNGTQLYDGTSGLKTKNWDAKTFPTKKGSVEDDITIYHNENGSVSDAAFIMYGSVSANATKQYNLSLPLTQLQRGSKLDSFSATNTTATYGYTKYVAGFYDRITFTSNGKTLGTVDNPKTTAGTFTNLTKAFTMSQVLAAATAAGSKTITVTATLKTYSDSGYTTQVGSTYTKTYDITLGSGTLSAINSLTIANSGAATFTPTISKWNSGTYDNLVVSGDSFSQTFTNVSSGTSYTLNNTNLFTAMGTNTSLTLSFTLKTYSSNGGALLGESTISNKTISLPSYNINASVNSYDDKNKSTSPGSMTNPLSYFKTSDSVMIKNLSSPKITFKVTSSTNYLYGRKISTTGAAVKSNLDHNATFDVEPGTNFNSSYSITATDGRKTSSAATKTFTVVPYFLPSVTVKIERTAPTASTATATVVAKYYNDSGSLLTNKKTISTINTAILTYTEYGGSAVTKSYSQANNVSTSTSGTTTTLTFTYNLTGLDYQKSINATSQFKDLIGYTVQGTDYEPNGLPVINAFRYNDLNHAKVNGQLIVDGSGIEIYNNNPYIDWHFNNSTANYTSRLIEWSSGVLTYQGNTFQVEKRLQIPSSYDTTYGIINDNNKNLLQTYDNHTIINGAGNQLILGGIQANTRDIVLHRPVAGKQLSNGAGTNGYMKIGTFKITSTYMNQPIVVEILQRSRLGNVYIQFSGGNTNDPSLSTFKSDGNISAYMYKSATSTWDLYVYKSEGYDSIDARVKLGEYSNSITFTWGNETISSLPSGYQSATIYCPYDNMTTFPLRRVVCNTAISTGKIVITLNGVAMDTLISLSAHSDVNNFGFNALINVGYTPAVISIIRHNENNFSYTISGNTSNGIQLTINNGDIAANHTFSIKAYRTANYMDR